MANDFRVLFLLVFPVLQDALIIYLIIRGISIFKNRRQNKKIQEVRISSIIFWPGMFLCCIFVIPFTRHCFEGASTSTLILLEIFILCGISAMLIYCFNIITYDNSGFVRTNILGISKKYIYTDITEIIRIEDTKYIQFGHSKTRMGLLYHGVREFLVKADKEYYRNTQKHIPTSEHEKRRGIRLSFTFTGIISIVMFSVFLFFSATIIGPADDHLPSETAVFKTSFSSYSYTRNINSELVLRSANYEKPFVITNISGYGDNKPDPTIICSGEVYILIVKEFKSKYEVYSISTINNQKIISPYDVNSAYRNINMPFALFCLIIGSFGILFSVFGLLTSRFPNLFPDWFNRLFRY